MAEQGSVGEKEYMLWQRGWESRGYEAISLKMHLNAGLTLRFILSNLLFTSFYCTNTAHIIIV